jgi:hypothetical protein
MCHSSEGDYIIRGGGSRSKIALRDYRLTTAYIKSLLEAGDTDKANYLQSKLNARLNNYEMAQTGIDMRGLLYEPFRNDEHLKKAAPAMAKAFSEIDEFLDGKETISNLKKAYDEAVAEAEQKFLDTKKVLDTQMESGSDKGQYRIKMNEANELRKSEIKDAQNGWQQMEWLGFHFENLMKKSLDNTVIQNDGPRFGSSTIDSWIHVDGVKKPVDLKFHSMNNRQGRAQVKVPLNDAEAVEACIAEYGVYYLLVAKADCEYDSDGSFKKWRENIQGGPSKVSLENIALKRSSRVRKTGARIREFSIYAITAENLPMLSNFKQGKQHSGAERKRKYILNFGVGGITPIVKFSTSYGVQRKNELDKAKQNAA